MCEPQIVFQVPGIWFIKKKSNNFNTIKSSKATAFFPNASLVLSQQNQHFISNASRAKLSSSPTKPQHFPITNGNKKAAFT
jgi:hypothetical protein